MIQMQTRLAVADNTGAKEVMCIKVLGAATGAPPAWATSSFAASRAVIARQRHQEEAVVRGVIVRCKQPTRRADGSYVRFDQQRGGDRRQRRQPRGTRIFGAVARELREENFMKIVSLAGRGGVMHIRVGDTVEVITGNDKGVRGKVLQVNREAGKLVVEGVNRVYKHVRRSQRNPQGGRLSKEMPVQISNVVLVCASCNAAARTGVRATADGGKER